MNVCNSDLLCISSHYDHSYCSLNGIKLAVAHTCHFLTKAQGVNTCPLFILAMSFSMFLALVIFFISQKLYLFTRGNFADVSSRI